jgi:hypothetical protein
MLISVSSRREHLGDPEFEPTDEQLTRVAHEAFSQVAARHRENLVRMRAEIAELRRVSLARLAQMKARASTGT